jgi:DNA polymerase V
MSARVMRVLSDFTPDLEFYSIDEAFLGLGGFEHRLEAHARELRARVMQWTGIPVSVGIAATKTLAKVANHRAKKDPACQGVCVMLDDAERGRIAQKGRVETPGLRAAPLTLCPVKNHPFWH